jgi:hypothetical protein
VAKYQEYNWRTIDGPLNPLGIKRDAKMDEIFSTDHRFREFKVCNHCFHYGSCVVDGIFCPPYDLALRLHRSESVFSDKSKSREKTEQINDEIVAMYKKGWRRSDLCFICNYGCKVPPDDNTTTYSSGCSAMWRIACPVSLARDTAPPIEEVVEQTKPLYKPVVRVGGKRIRAPAPNWNEYALHYAAKIAKSHHMDTFRAFVTIKYHGDPYTYELNNHLVLVEHLDGDLDIVKG